MMDLRQLYTGITLLLVLFLISACGSQQSPEPTVDLVGFRTEVAATVLAQVTQPACPTEATDTPTATAINTAVMQPSATMNLPTIAVTGTLGVSTAAPTTASSPGTTAAATSAGLNLAEWASQSVADGSIFAPGEAFTITWGLKNTGTTTWTPGYMLRYYGGEPFGAPKEVLVNQTVLPGQTALISVPMIAPGQPGDYRSDWVMATDIRFNFKQSVYIEITVQRPPTNTPVPTATAVPTAASQT